MILAEARLDMRRSNSFAIRLPGMAYIISGGIVVELYSPTTINNGDAINSISIVSRNNPTLADNIDFRAFTRSVIFTRKSNFYWRFFIITQSSRAELSGLLQPCHKLESLYHFQHEFENNDHYLFCSVLCFDMAIKQIDEPFITKNREEWAL
jgi:hypothetical protein